MRTMTITVGEKHISLDFETPGQDQLLLVFNQVIGNYPDCHG